MRTRSKSKRQKREAALAAICNPDILYSTSAFLSGKDLASVAATCRALGQKKPSTGRSMVAEAARRLLGTASTAERGALPPAFWRDGAERWIVAYHLLAMLRSELQFGLFVGRNVVRGAGDAIALSAKIPSLDLAAAIANESESKKWSKV